MAVQKRLKCMMSVLVGIILLSSCGPTAQPTLPPEQSLPTPHLPAPQPALTPSTNVGMDCIVYGEVLAWEDHNENQQMDAGEQPLAGVQITFHQRIFLTDSTGRVEVVDGFYGATEQECDRLGKDTIVSIVSPKGYRLTTPQQANLGTERTIQFGLVKR